MPISKYRNVDMNKQSEKREHYIVGTCPKSKKKLIERGKIVTPNT